MRRKTLVEVMAARLPEPDGDLVLDPRVACERQDKGWELDVLAEQEELRRLVARMEDEGRIW